MSRITWPGGNASAAAFTFDEDGETVAFGYDKENAAYRMSLQSEATYGPEVGLPRILDVLDEHKVPATFFVPGYTAERHEAAVREIVKRGHEVAHHGYLHERPDLLDERQEEEILQRGTRILERITGRKPRGYRAPSWEMKERTPRLLRNNGLLYDSSLMGDDEPYRIAAGQGEELLEIPVHWTNDDWVHFGFCSSPQLGNGISSPSKVFDTWSEEFLGYHQFGGCFVLTLHPFVIGRPSRIRLLDRMIRLITGTDKVWIATLEQIADFMRESGTGRFHPPADMRMEGNQEFHSVKR
ncbi:MAG: polysaccharide deacetylase family protein [Spirochaetia bacterium]